MFNVAFTLNSDLKFTFFYEYVRFAILYHIIIIRMYHTLYTIININKQVVYYCLLKNIYDIYISYIYYKRANIVLNVK